MVRRRCAGARWRLSLGHGLALLVGPFCDSLDQGSWKNADTLKRARGFLDGIGAHLTDVCLGQVSEIFDAEAPHRARGCYAQAWSVAEPLRALIEDLGIHADTQKVMVKRAVVGRRKEMVLQSTQGREERACGEQTRPRSILDVLLIGTIRAERFSTT